MSRIFRSLPPKGTRLAIAYSGGLDTRCAVAWLREQGMEVYAYTADLAQPDEQNPADIPPTALDHGAKAARLLDCKEGLVRKGTIAIQCGAFHLSVGGKKYFNTTPLRSEEHTSELQSHVNLVCRLLLEKKNNKTS